MAFLPVVLAGVGAVVQAVGAIQQAGAQATAANANARIAEQNATLARQQAKVDEARRRRLARKELGALRASVGASGINFTGSALDVYEDSFMEAELDALTIRHNGEIEALGFQKEAALNRQRAKSAKIGGAFEATGLLLSGAADAISSARNLSPKQSTTG